MQATTVVVALALAAGISAPSFAATAEDCPNGGTVRFGVEPFDTAPKLLPIYDQIAKLISAKLNCNVEMQVTTSYNAEIEAMRSGKLEAGEFGPLGYVLAHQVAKAEAVAAYAQADGKPSVYWASIVVPAGSSIKTVEDLKGHTFAFSDPASTSGHLFPAYGMRKAGIDPDKDVKGIFAGSHTSSFEALRNKKVDAGELNSQQIESAKQRGAYKDGDYVFIWKSGDIPNDPIAVRGDLPAGFKARFTAVLQSIDLSGLSEADRKIIDAEAPKLVPQTDSAYDQIRDLVKTLNIDLTKLDS
ncbi:MAG: phosphate/phosphite/phosphonate ABC transporter substrate-binding protein [Alphaproteobacteria bacterium]|nr:phosphate/phosphite/phosphonate ABC transporter substrate-binding protein [Alphaproteobacteria bacterium]